MSTFTTQETGQVITIKLPPVLNEEAGQTFTRHAKSWMSKPQIHVVLDFTGVDTITPEFYKSIIMFKTNLRRDMKSIYSLNMSPKLLKQIRDKGMEQAFNPIKSLDVGAQKAKPKTAVSGALDVAFINPFLVGTQKTLEIQCQTKIKILTPYLKKEAIPNIGIAGVLSLQSDGFNGSIVLCFSAPVFLKIYENMFGEKHDVIKPEMEDAAGELLNIIYGTAKIELNQKGYNFQRALPTVLSGEKLNIRQAGVEPAVIIPFETAAGNFHIEIEFHSTTGATDV